MVYFFLRGSVAQLAEQGTHKPLVAGSNPAATTYLLCESPKIAVNNMNNKSLIREIYKDEEAKACQLVIECFNAFVAPDYSVEGVNEFLKYASPDSMRERLERGNFVFVAVVDDSIVGVI